MTVFALAAAAALIGVAEQGDGREPTPWRPLTAQESRAFELGYAVFNTQWAEADAPAGRRDGVGPLFNAPSCDACHNSRRRGRGPLDAGPAPLDLVVQLGTRRKDGRVAHGSERFGAIINTSANGGLRAEAVVNIRYESIDRRLPDGTRIELRAPTYEVIPSDAVPLLPDLVLMPRLPPAVQGAGLLERVSQSEIEQPDTRNRGRVSWLDIDGRRQIGRFGWQAGQPSVARQIAAAFGREMGLTTTLEPHIDCGSSKACAAAPSGGTPEVEAGLFDALLLFQDLHAVPRVAPATGPIDGVKGAALFENTGCAICHRPQLRLDSVTGDAQGRFIQPYTDLLLHDLGSGLADRDVSGKPVRSDWRTAPLWGLSASVATGRPLRKLPPLVDRL